MLHSTLRRYVEALGGNLELVAEFPDRPRMLSLPNADPEKSHHSTQSKSKRGAKTRHPDKTATARRDPVLTGHGLIA